MTLLDQILRHEGLRLFPYTDTTGHVTIGVGRNLTTTGISREEALGLLRHDLARTEAGLRQRYPWFDRLDPMRQRVLVDMAFNLGLAGFARFTDMITAVASQRWEHAARAMLKSRWATQVGARANRLAAMMRTGEEAS